MIGSSAVGRALTPLKIDSPQSLRMQLWFCACSKRLPAWMEDLAKQGFHALPQDVVWNILEKLPVRSLAVVRCLCSTWNRLVSSQVTRTPARPWCFLLTGLLQYDVQRDFFTQIVEGDRLVDRCNQPFTSAATCWGFSPGDMRWFKFTPPEPEVPDAAFFNTYVSSSSGLIAFQQLGSFRNQWDGSAFCVGNPLTGKWRTIPFSHVQQMAHLVVDDASKCYKLVVFLLRHGPQLEPLDMDQDIPPAKDVVWTTHVYDSAVQAWTVGQTVSQGPPISHKGSCYFDGVVYFLQWCDEEKLLLQVMAYHIASDQFSVAVPPGLIRHTKAPSELGEGAVGLTTVLQVMVKKGSGDALVLEFLGAISYQVAFSETLCVFKYNYLDACWVQDTQRQFKISDISRVVTHDELFYNCCGHAGMAYFTPSHSESCAAFLAYDSDVGQFTYMSHPGLRTKLEKQIEDTRIVDKVAAMVDKESTLNYIDDDYFIQRPKSDGEGPCVRVSCGEYFMHILEAYHQYIGQPSYSRCIEQLHLRDLSIWVNFLEQQEARLTSLTTSICSFVPRLDIEP